MAKIEWYRKFDFIKCFIIPYTAGDNSKNQFGKTEFMIIHSFYIFMTLGYPQFKNLIFHPPGVITFFMLLKMRNYYVQVNITVIRNILLWLQLFCFKVWNRYLLTCFNVYHKTYPSNDMKISCEKIIIYFLMNIDKQK